MLFIACLLIYHFMSFSTVFVYFLQCSPFYTLCISCVKCFVVDAVACVFACALTSAVRGLLPVVV